MISGTPTKISSSNPSPCKQRLLESSTEWCNLVLLLSLSLSLSVETRRRNKDKGEERRRNERRGEREVLPRSRIALFSSCTLSTRHHIRTHTREHRANTYTHPVRIVPHSKSSQGPQPVPSPSASPFFSLHLFLPFYTTVCLFLVPDTRPTCKSCRDLVYLRDSRFPTTGVFPPKLDRPLSGRFFSVFLLLFLFWLVTRLNFYWFGERN